MATRDITFSLNHQRFTIPLTFDQFTGIIVFTQDYNTTNFNTELTYEGEFEMNRQVPNVPLYVVKGGMPRREDLRAWENWQDDEEHNICMEEVSTGIPILDWSRFDLQGYITAAQWLGANWRDYVTNITINDLPATIE